MDWANARAGRRQMIVMIATLFLWMLSLSALLWGASTDLRERIIPDRVSLLVAASGLLITLLLRPAEIYASLIACAVVFIGLCLLGYFDFVGGGDVKLISAVSSLVPPSEVGVLLLEIAVTGGLLSGAYLFARFWLRRNVPVASDVGDTLSWSDVAPEPRRGEAARILSGEPMPYAFAILGGVLFHGVREVCQCYLAASCLF